MKVPSLHGADHGADPGAGGAAPGSEASSRSRSPSRWRARSRSLGRARGGRWTAWDAQIFGRALGAAAATLLLSWLVTAATDEGGVPWGQRLGRTLPLAPLCAALGVAAALAPATWRGEAGALAALGRSRLQIAMPGALGGALVAASAALALGVVARVDVNGFYPTATRASAWRWDGTAFVDGLHGLRVAADGMPTKTAIEAGALLNALPPHARAAAALTTAVAGLALPLLLAHALLGRRSDRAGARARRAEAALVAATVGSIAASVVLFQAAAARQVPAGAAVVPAALLLALAFQRYRAAP